MSALYRHGGEGLRLPRRLHQRRRIGPGQRNFPLATHWGDRPAAPASLCVLPACGGGGAGGPPLIRRHARFHRAGGSPGRHSAPRFLHSSPFTALCPLLLLSPSPSSCSSPRASLLFSP